MKCYSFAFTLSFNKIYSITYLLGVDDEGKWKLCKQIMLTKSLKAHGRKKKKEEKEKKKKPEVLIYCLVFFHLKQNSVSLYFTRCFDFHVVCVLWCRLNS